MQLAEFVVVLVRRRPVSGACAPEFTHAAAYGLEALPDLPPACAVRLPRDRVGCSIAFSPFLLEPSYMSDRHPLERGLCTPQEGQILSVNGRSYRLGEIVGEGAAGVVTLATEVISQSRVAVKFLAPDPKYIDPENFDDVAERFMREGLKGKSLDHENLLEIFAYSENLNGSALNGTGPSNPFLVMEYVEGLTLERYLAGAGRREGSRFDATVMTLEIASQLAKAVRYLHGKKHVHRDIKPANIFLSRRRGGYDVKLGDFGIMKWGDFQSSLTTGTLTATAQAGLGTLKYMSPEQALKPRDVTVRSDIYSLGITLFELFTGEVLPSPHHVFRIVESRYQRGTMVSKLASVDYRLDPLDGELAELVLDMHLRSPNSPWLNGDGALAKASGLRR